MLLNRDGSGRLRARARHDRRTPPALLLALLLLLPLAGCSGFRRRLEDRPAYRKVTPAVAYAITLDAPEALIIDLRRPDEFQGETGHIRNARNIPLKRLPYRMIELSGYREDTILVYCRAGDTCGPDGMAVLVASGFDDAILIEGGIDRWIRDGFKTALSVEGAQGSQGPPR